VEYAPEVVAAVERRSYDANLVPFIYELGNKIKIFIRPPEF
jgi:hypothetical protein